MSVPSLNLQPIPSIDEFLSRDSSGLANTVLDPCPECGRKHPTPFGAIRQGRGMVSQVPVLAEAILGRAPQAPVLIYDQAIEDIILPTVAEPLRQAGLSLTLYPMRGEPGHLLDSGVDNGDQAAHDIGPGADLLIGAGSGVISDLTKWIATQLERPFLVCGTAPSMNGYTSITATMTEHDIKISKFLNPANAVVLDVDILSQAPMKMIHAGVGDLAARAVCNADWKLSQLLRDTYFCPLPYWMTAENERRYLAAAEGIGQRDPASIELLSEAILLSGLSMTVLEGETSPSSGAEHVISHYWDLLTHIHDAPKNLHGAQVGVGTILMLTAYEYLQEIDPTRLDPQKILRSRRSLEEIETENCALYGDKCASFNETARKKFIPDQQHPEYLSHILNSWDLVMSEVRGYLASVESIRRPFEQAGVPYSLASVQRTREQARNALLHGSYYRPRYTLLDLLWELGLFPQAADEIIERAGVL
jgi:glycerol-1-phosphate dehydrogenase [NAD(P)+]